MPYEVPQAQGFWEQRARSDQETNQRAAYASSIAEALGGYTPELQHEALLPLGDRPTLGENLLGAPVRGIGHLIGNEQLQQFAAPQNFNIGTLPQQESPSMPTMPAGLPPEVSAQLQQMASELGFGAPQGKPRTIPSMPSETSGRSTLKTKYERDREAAMQQQAWDFITKIYQTEEQKNQMEAQTNQLIQSAQESKAREKEIDARRARGLPPSQWTLTKEYMDENPDQDFVTVMKALNAAKGNTTAKLQIYNAAKAAGDFDGTYEQWEQVMNRAKWNPIDAYSEMFYSNPFTAFSIPLEEHPKRIAQGAITLGLAAEQYNQEMLARGKGDAVLGANVPIPQELLALGVNERDIAQVMEAEGINRAQALIKLQKHWQQQQKPKKPGTAPAP